MAFLTPCACGGDHSAESERVTSASQGLTRDQVDGFFIPPTSFVMPSGPSSGTWRYSTSESQPGWTAPAFDDTAWAQGQAGFFFGGPESQDVPTTPWPPAWERLLLRKTFRISATDIPNAVFWTRWDDDIHVFINGVLAIEQRSFSSGYRYLGISAEARATLSATAPNTLAVEVVDRGGGRYFDLGVTTNATLRSPPLTGFDVNPRLAVMTNAVQTYMMAHAIPAGVFAFGKDGAVKVSHGFGWMDKAFSANRPVPPDAVMRLASNDKVITWAAVHRVLDLGTINPADGQPVTATTRVFPLLTAMGLKPLASGVADPTINDVTVDDLLQHRGRLAEVPAVTFTSFYQALGVPNGDSLTQDDNIRWVYSQPRVPVAGYNSSGYSVLRYMVQRLKGDLVTYLRSELFAQNQAVFLAHERLADRSPLEPWYANLNPPYDRWIDLENYTSLATSAPAFVQYAQSFTAFGLFFGGMDGTWTVTSKLGDRFAYAIFFNEVAAYDELRATIEDIARALPADAWVPAVGGPTSVSLQAEDGAAATTFHAVIESTHTGFSGTGYVNPNNEVGSFIEWTVNAPAAGQAALQFRFANGSVAARPVRLDVNGATAVASLSFPGTSSWDVWSTTGATVNLVAGVNRIRLTSTATAGGPNFDRMDATLPGGSSGGPGVFSGVVRWPVNGALGHDWVVENYCDINPATGVAADYWNQGHAPLTTDGYMAYDIAIPSFRQMDDGSAKVVAVADGVVTLVQDGNADRNVLPSQSPPPSNQVEILHDNGYSAKYLHLKRNSITVTANQRVKAGQVIGVVGSSGDSTEPHLTFAISQILADGTKQPVCPSDSNFFPTTPFYRPNVTVMDMMLRQGAIDTSTTKDPVANVTALQRGQTLGVGLAIAGGDNDLSPGGYATQYTVRLVRPDGVADNVFSPSGGLRGGLTFAPFNFPISATAPTGLWTVEVYFDGTLADSRGVTITAGGPTTTTYQAENATLGQSVTETTNAGFTGTGYVNTDNVVGSFVEWRVTASASGPATLGFVDALGGSTARPASVTINGAVAVSSLNFPPTGAWTTWSTTPVTATLQAGVNTVRLTSLTSGGCANLDRLDVTQ